MYGQLVPCGGGTPVPLLKPRLIVGRTSDCDVPVQQVTVSSKHCLLEQRDGVWYATDLASRNGIRIDGVRCQEGPLPPGCVLWIAQQRYHVEYTIKGKNQRVAAPAGATPPGAVTVSTARPPEPTVDKVASKVEPPTRPPNPAPKRGVTLGELIPCGGGDPIPLLKPNLLVGRSPACDITLAFPMVSSKHCQLEFKSGYWHVRDLGSRNGIRVDGIVQMSKFLKPGEILWIAKHRYEIAYTPLSDEPPPEENPFALSLMEKAGLAGKRGGSFEAQFTAQGSQSPDEEPARKKWKIDE